MTEQVLFGFIGGIRKEKERPAWSYKSIWIRKLERAYGTATNHLWFVLFLARPVLMCSPIIVGDILGERQRELTSK